MIMKSQEIAFNGSKITQEPDGYEIRTIRIEPGGKYLSKVVITRNMNGHGAVAFRAEEIPDLIAELEILAMFMKTNGILDEEDQDEQEEDSARSD